MLLIHTAPNSSAAHYTTVKRFNLLIVVSQLKRISYTQTSTLHNYVLNQQVFTARFQAMRKNACCYFNYFFIYLVSLCKEEGLMKGALALIEK